jgi:hypothetical protein
MREYELNYISDAFKEMTEGAEAGVILKILSNLSAEIIIRISIDVDKDYKEIAEDFRKDVSTGADLFIQRFKEEYY